MEYEIKISKEKKKLIGKLKSKGSKNPYVEAGEILNKKYGKCWRDNLRFKKAKGL
jgi:hypothetical protein